MKKLFVGILLILLSLFSLNLGYAQTASQDAVINGKWTFEQPTDFKSTINVGVPKLTPGSRTGMRVLSSGALRTLVYKVTLDKEAFYAASVSNDVTIATLPAKSVVHGVIAYVDTPFVCAATCTTATLSATLGISAGGVEYLESFDLDAAAAAFGDTDAEAGSKVDVAANSNGGYWSWASSSVIMRGTSGTGNWGNGTVTNLSAGQVTFYILYSVMP